MDDQITETDQDLQPAEQHIDAGEAEQETSLAEVAKEMFGDEYHGESEEPEETEETEEPEFFDNAEEAARHVIDQHRADERIEQDMAEEAPAPVQTEAEPVSDAVWSSDDVEKLQFFNKAAEIYRNDVKDVAEIKNQLNQSGLERTDRAQAVAYQAQIRDAERELAQRRQTLSGMQDEFNGKVEEHTAAQERSMMTAEHAKLMAAIPGFDKKAEKQVANYLEGSGFTQDELSKLTDHRMVIAAHKAMLYDDIMAGKKKVPKQRKKGPANRSNDSDALFVKLEKTGRIGDAVAALTAQRRERSDAPVPKAVQKRKIAALKAKAEKTHSFDDVVAYHTARRRQAKQAGARR